MKLTILKFFKKDKLPPLDSLRPRFFGLLVYGYGSWFL